MDAFSRTFLPAAAEAGVAAPLATRHLAVIRRCVQPDDSAVLVTRCARPDAPQSGDFLLVLTTRRLVVTRESRLFHRLGLHLNANLRHLAHVAWSTDPRDGTTELSATAVDGVRERFQIRVARPDHLDTALTRLFTQSRRSVSLAA